MRDASVVSWNSIISAHVRRAELSQALHMFLQMDSCPHVSLDSYSVTPALGACARAGATLLPLGASIHSKIIKSGFESSTVVSNCLIHMYAKCGSLSHAIRAFHTTLHKDTVSWNSIIAACAAKGLLEQALGFQRRMPSPDTISYNALIKGFAEYGEIEESIKILRAMPNPSSSSWNSIITGHVNRNRAPAALVIFGMMHSQDVAMDEFTFSSLLSGVARLSASTWGRLTHCCAVKRGFEASTVVVSALIDMYSKCGQVDEAHSAFVSTANKNLVSWNAMLSGFAHNGRSTRVMELFQQLRVERNVNPDEITFLSVLSSCSHNPTPSETALEYCRMMIEEYRIEPSINHCCCLVRVMKGDLRSATKVIYELGFGGSGRAWRALLGACESYRDVKIAEIVAAKVIELEGDNGHAYNLLSNIYASCGRWETVSAVRKLIRDTGIRKEAAYSWIQVENAVPDST